MNKGNDTVNKIASIIFYIMVLLEIVIVILDKSDYINPLEGQLFRITFALAVGKILLTRYSLKEWIWIAVFGLLGIASYYATGRNEIIRIAAFVCACKNIELGKLMSFVFYTTLAGCLVLMVMSITGIYGNPAIYTDFGRGMKETRYCLGIGHPNALHCMVFMLTLLALYLYEKQMKWYSFIFAFLVNIGFFVLTDSKTGMMVTTMAIVLTAVFHYFPNMGGYRLCYIGGILLLLSFILLSVSAAQYGIENPVLRKLDGLLNGRILDLYWGSANHEGTTAHWSLFSDRGNTYYFDMGYVRVFYWYGIIPAVVCFVMNVLLFWECYKKKDTMGLVILITLAVYTVVEAHIVSVYIGRNYILFLLGAYWSDILHAKNREKEEYLWTGFRFLQGRG